MKIGILGSGAIGGSLGRLWAKAGHEVCFGSREPSRLRELVEAAGNGARAGTIDEAAEFGEVVLEAVPFKAVPELPVDVLAGKITLSAANYYPSRDGDIDLHGMTHSEWVASKLGKARIVKAFNMMQAGVMQKLADGEGKSGLAILIASDDEQAKDVAASLVRDAKFEPLDAGSLADSSLFQSPDGPLYDVQMIPEEAKKLMVQEQEAP